MSMLDPSSVGRWAVRTDDADHIFDLDAATYERRPAPNVDPQDGIDDHVAYYLLLDVAEWPRTGGRFLISYSLRADPWRRSHALESATITEIAPASSAVEELAKTLPGSPAIRIPSGWCPLVQQLHAELIDLEPRYIATAVKDKHDRLRFYIVVPEDTPSGIADAMYARIDWAEDESGSRCTLCGAPTLTPGTRCTRHPW